ncbi:MAG TPA: hypothetical protein PKB10_08455 [Tepidisphaeraceae bacterium]|nr:hypothetical protein [Tepidisphaeraceae bacterium]
MSSRRTADVSDARMAAAMESLEPRRLLSIAPALLDDAQAGIAGAGSVYAARESAEAWQSVPSANFSQIQPSQFTAAELRYVQPLFWFSTLANSVVENATASLPRGWINIKVWREPGDNQPYNARVLENHVAFAFFYTTDRPWRRSSTCG